MDTSELQKAKDAIYSADLQPVIDRLIKIEHWSRADAEEATQQYRNYLFLRKKYPDHTLPPSKDIDEVWHAHILHTKEYRNFCMQVFSDRDNGYLDHFPQQINPESLRRVASSFEQTQGLYYREFGNYIYQVTRTSFYLRILDAIKSFFSTKLRKLFSHEVMI